MLPLCFSPDYLHHRVVICTVANVGSLLASLSPLGQTAGYPLTQTALLVAGAIGKWGGPLG